MLHYAIFRATSVATAKSAFLQLHEQRCYTLQCFLQLVLQLVPQRMRLKLKAYFYWLIAQNIARQVSRGCYTVQCLKNTSQRCRNRCEKQNLILLRATLAATKMLRDLMIARYVTQCNFSCNLCRNKIARQVARKVAQCNTALRLL